MSSGNKPVTALCSVLILTAGRWWGIFAEELDHDWDNQGKKVSLSVYWLAK